jgi:hypothetical protein
MKGVESQITWILLMTRRVIGFVPSVAEAPPGDDMCSCLRRALTLVPRASRPQGGVPLLLATNGSAFILRAGRPRYQAVRPWRAAVYCGEPHESPRSPRVSSTLLRQGYGECYGERSLHSHQADGVEAVVGGGLDAADEAPAGGFGSAAEVGERGEQPVEVGAAVAVVFDVEA